MSKRVVIQAGHKGITSGSVGAPGHTNTNSNRTGESTYNCGQDCTKIHPSVAVSSDNYSLASTNTTANSSSNEPEYKTVAFIKLAQLSTGSAFFLNFL